MFTNNHQVGLKNPRNGMICQATNKEDAEQTQQDKENKNPNRQPNDSSLEFYLENNNPNRQPNDSSLEEDMESDPVQQFLLDLESSNGERIEFNDQQEVAIWNALNKKPYRGQITLCPTPCADGHKEQRCPCLQPKTIFNILYYSARQTTKEGKYLVDDETNFPVASTGDKGTRLLTTDLEDILVAYPEILLVEDDDTTQAAYVSQFLKVYYFKNNQRIVALLPSARDAALSDGRIPPGTTAASVEPLDSSVLEFFDGDRKPAPNEVPEVLAASSLQVVADQAPQAQQPSPTHVDLSGGEPCSLDDLLVPSFQASTSRLANTNENLDEIIATLSQVGISGDGTISGDILVRAFQTINGSLRDVTETLNEINKFLGACVKVVDRATRILAGAIRKGAEELQQLKAENKELKAHNKMLHSKVDKLEVWKRAKEGRRNSI